MGRLTFTDITFTFFIHQTSPNQICFWRVVLYSIIAFNDFQWSLKMFDLLVNGPWGLHNEIFNLRGSGNRLSFCQVFLLLQYWCLTLIKCLSKCKQASQTLKREFTTTFWTSLQKNTAQMCLYSLKIIILTHDSLYSHYRPAVNTNMFTVLMCTVCLHSRPMSAVDPFLIYCPHVCMILITLFLVLFCLR